MTEDVFTKLDGKEIKWQDKRGIVHAVEGSDVHPGIRLLWPRCLKGGVPANQGFHGDDPVTCPDCLARAKKEEQK